MRVSLLCAAALIALPANATAQTTVVDEGSFTITRAGTRVAREEFWIRRTGETFRTSATVVFDDRRMVSSMETDSTGSPTRYQLETRAGEDAERMVGQVGGGRMSVRSRTPRGEAAREYVVSSGALVLEDEVFHQYYFLSRMPRGASVPVVIPRRNTQLALRVQDAGTERLNIGGTSIEARVLRLSEPGGTTRQVWVDGNGRVLRVAVDGGLTATRDEPPR